jgi:hypothetical protein
MECFGRPDALEKTFMRSIEAYALDADDNFNSKLIHRSSRPEAMYFLQMAKESRIRIKRPGRFETGYRLL